MSFLLFSFALIFPFIYKYSYVITNQFSQIPIILSFLDPRYLINDWYVLVNRTFGPRTIFAWYMAQTAKIFSLPSSFFFHYLLYVFLVIFSTYKLTFFIFKRKFVALTTTICILFGTSLTLGGNMLITQDFVAPQLPLGLSLLAIVFLMEKKYFFAAILFSLTSYLHPLIGFESAFLFLFVNLVITVLSKQSPRKIITSGIFPYLLFSLPAIILYFSEGIKNTVPDADKLAILAFMRIPHHFVPSSFPFSSYFFFIFLLFFFIICTVILKKVIDKSLLFSFYLTISLILFFCLLGFIAAEIIPFYPFVVLQFFRLTLYVYWLAAIIVFGTIFYFSYEKPRFSLLIFIPIFLTNPYSLLTIDKTRIFSLVLGLFLILFYRALPKKISLILICAIFALGRYHGRFNYASFIKNPTPETDLAIWAKKNTFQEALFLIPPEFESFRLIANRAVVADWKSFPFQEEAMYEWAQRMCDIGNLKDCQFRNISLDMISNGYRTHTQNSVQQLAHKYHFQYLITKKRVDLKEIYATNNYFVYKLMD